MDTPGLDNFTRLVLVHKGHSGTEGQINGVLTNALIDSYTDKQIMEAENYLAQLELSSVAKLVIYGCPGDVPNIVRDVLHKVDRCIRDCYAF